MSPPEVWGPAVWYLFHTLAEKINENAYSHLSLQLFNFFVRICNFLPCPECSKDASSFLAKIKPENLKTKLEFKNTFYLFHNVVNLKKRKYPFKYSNINVYQKYKLLPIIRNFFISYNTKGNMKLLNESFQRNIIIKDFSKWFNSNITAFISPLIRKNPNIKNPNESEEPVNEEPVDKEETDKESPSNIEKIEVEEIVTPTEPLETQEFVTFKNSSGCFIAEEDI